MVFFTASALYTDAQVGPPKGINLLPELEAEVSAKDVPKSTPPPYTPRSFHLSDRTYLHASYAVERELFVAAMLAKSGEPNNFERLLSFLIANGQVLILPAGSEVTLTGRADNLSAEVRVKPFPGAWRIPRKAVEAAGISPPPADPKYAADPDAANAVPDR